MIGIGNYVSGGRPLGEVSGAALGVGGLAILLLIGYALLVEPGSARRGSMGDYHQRVYYGVRRRW